MPNLTQLDINVYLQLSNCCFSSQSAEFTKDLKWGRKCSEQTRMSLMLLSILIEILNCYRVGEDDNCYTEEEIQVLVQNIGNLTGICFKPPGYAYTIPTGYVLDTETGTISLD